MNHNISFLDINLLLSIIAFLLNIIKTKLIKIDPFEIMNILNETLEQINNEKLTNFVNNLMNATVNQPMIGYIFSFMICCIPVINIYIIISSIDQIKKGSI